MNRYAYAYNSPYEYHDPDGEAASADKTIYKAYRHYSKTGNLNKSDLRRIGGQELVDIGGDLYTVFGNPKSSIVDKVKAGVDLVIGLETNNKGANVAEEALESASSIGSKLVKKFKQEGNSINHKN